MLRILWNRRKGQCRMEKVIYYTPEMFLLIIEREDVLCTSADTDVPFWNPDTDVPFISGESVTNI